MPGAISTAMRDRLRARLTVAALNLPQTFGLDQRTWAVRRASTGDGLRTPIIPAEQTALISGWVYLSHPKTIVLDGALFQPNDEWRFVAVSGTNVQVGDELVSAVDAVTRTYDTGYSFTVLSVETLAGYLVAILEAIA